MAKAKDFFQTNSCLGSADASDFYLGADLPSPESIKIYVDTFDSGTLDQLNLTPYIKTEPSGKRYVTVTSCAACTAWAVQDF